MTKKPKKPVFVGGGGFSHSIAPPSERGVGVGGAVEKKKGVRSDRRKEVRPVVVGGKPGPKGGYAHSGGLKSAKTPRRSRVLETQENQRRLRVAFILRVVWNARLDAVDRARPRGGSTVREQGRSLLVSKLGEKSGWWASSARWDRNKDGRPRIYHAGEFVDREAGVTWEASFDRTAELALEFAAAGIELGQGLVSGGAGTEVVVDREEDGVRRREWTFRGATVADGQRRAYRRADGVDVWTEEVKQLRTKKKG